MASTKFDSKRQPQSVDIAISYTQRRTIPLANTGQTVGGYVDDLLSTLPVDAVPAKIVIRLPRD